VFVVSGGMATETEMTSLADALVAPTLAAARAIMKYYRQDVAVMTKGDDSPVTKADRKPRRFCSRC